MDKVLISPAQLAGLQAEFVNVLEHAGFELVYPKKKSQMVEDELIEQLTGIRASLAGSEPYTKKILQSTSAAARSSPGPASKLRCRSIRAAASEAWASRSRSPGGPIRTPSPSTPSR